VAPTSVRASRRNRKEENARDIVAAGLEFLFSGRYPRGQARERWDYMWPLPVIWLTHLLFFLRELAVIIDVLKLALVVSATVPVTGLFEVKRKERRLD
jgi:hypothetical protein